MIYRGTPAGRRAEAARQARRAAPRTIEVSARSVTRWLAAGGFPERKPRSGHTSSLDPYKATLLERWKEGCHNAAHLWRMTQAQGFAGCYELVANYLAPLRRGEAVAERQANLPPAAPTTSS